MYKQNYNTYFHLCDAIMENMTDAFAIHRIELNKSAQASELVFIDVNTAFEKLFSLKASELIERTADELLSQPNKNDVRYLNIYKRIELNNQSIAQEVHCNDVNRWYSIKQINFNDEFLVLMFTDLTWQKLLEKAIRVSKD